MVNVKFSALADHFPFIGVAVWVAITLTVWVRRPDAGKCCRKTFKGTVFLLSLVTCASMMPVEQFTPCFRAGCPGSGFYLSGFRQHSADRTGLETGWLRLGLPRLCRRFWRVDDLVRFIRRRGAFNMYPEGQIRSATGCVTAGTSHWPMSWVLAFSLSHWAGIPMLLHKTTPNPRVESLAPQSWLRHNNLCRHEKRHLQRVAFFIYSQETKFATRE